MNVSLWVWAVTLVGLMGILAFDLLLVIRRPHEPSIREASAWAVFYVVAAVAFGLWVWAGYGATHAGEFFAGFLIEKSLSVDNLFLFLVILGTFAVPRQYQSRVLLVGIVLALVMRGLFIATGAVLISHFLWIYYLFGLFLIATAVRLARHKEDDPSRFTRGRLVGRLKKVLPITREYHGARLTTVVKGRRVVTPMLLVMVAIGFTDLVFALDSIPAIFGVTREPYLVFTANVFSLLGLRQLYFVIGGLVQRLVYLSAGLALVLAFIGGKMVVEALAENTVPFINGGQPVSWAPHLPIWLSLTIIGTILASTAVASLLRSAHLRRLAPAEADP